jgi:hypothetical protein
MVVCRSAHRPNARNLIRVLIDTANGPVCFSSRTNRSESCTCASRPGGGESADASGGADGQSQGRPYMDTSRSRTVRSMISSRTPIHWPTSPRIGDAAVSRTEVGLYMSGGLTTRAPARRGPIPSALRRTPTLIGCTDLGKVVHAAAGPAATDSDCRIGGHAMTAADVRGVPPQSAVVSVGLPGVCSFVVWELCGVAAGPRRVPVERVWHGRLR